MNISDEKCLKNHQDKNNFLFNKIYQDKYICMRCVEPRAALKVVNCLKKIVRLAEYRLSTKFGVNKIRNSVLSRLVIMNC